MRSSSVLSASVLVVLGLCLGSPAAAQPPPAVTGPITHVITGFEQRPFLPADWTQEEFAVIAADEPAPDGHVWYVLQGNARNNGTEARSIDVNTYKILDGAGNEYSFKPQPKFIPDGMMPSYIDVAPWATAEWMAVFAIPLDAEGLRLRFTDMQLVPDETKVIGIPGPQAAAAAPSDAPSIVGTWVLDEERSNAADDGNTAGLMATVQIKGGPDPIRWTV